MKKLLSVLAMVLVLSFVASVTFAALPADPVKRVKTVVVTSSGVVSTAKINSNDLILGYTVATTGGTAGGTVALLDAADVAGSVSTTYVFAEAEVSSDVGCVTIWFPYAKQISTQLGVYIASCVSGTVGVTIYYEDR